MSSIYEIRRENLRTLIRERGNGEVSKAAGYSTPSYISQMAGRKAQRPVTEQTARKIEEALGLSERWLDVERDPYGNPVVATRPENTTPPVENTIPMVVLDQDKFTRCAVAVSNAMGAAGATLTAKKFTTIVTALLNQADQSESALNSTAAMLVQLAV